MTAIKNFEWKRFFTRLVERSFDADIVDRSAQVAFYFTFALFPLIYFLVSLFGLILESSDGIKGEMFTYLRRLMPFAVFELVRKTIDEIITNSTGGKATLGLVISLWSASAGVDAIRSALNAANRHRHKPTPQHPDQQRQLVGRIRPRPNQRTTTSCSTRG